MNEGNLTSREFHETIPHSTHQEVDYSLFNRDQTKRILLQEPLNAGESTDNNRILVFS